MHTVHLFMALRLSPAASSPRTPRALAGRVAGRRRATLALELLDVPIPRGESATSERSSRLHQRWGDAIARVAMAQCTHTHRVLIRVLRSRGVHLQVGKRGRSVGLYIAVAHIQMDLPM